MRYLPSNLFQDLDLSHKSEFHISVCEKKYKYLHTQDAH
ncbi:hypothetical protein BVRB_9g220000 [Beta vulgaris subsp. vulgaris]|nr:hypothetical protein BVRB_9g220000 [Beta vulgaris subsp. vulgaris]